MNRLNLLSALLLCLILALGTTVTASHSHAELGDSACQVCLLQANESVTSNSVDQSFPVCPVDAQWQESDTGHRQPSSLPPARAPPVHSC